MTEIIYVRKEKCEGCLYSDTAIVSQRQVGITYLKKNVKSTFNCHCFSDQKQNVLCNGFYNAHKERFKDRMIRLINKKGNRWQYYLHHAKPGTFGWRAND